MTIMSRPEDDGGFLSRWARRKQEARREEVASSQKQSSDLILSPSKDEVATRSGSKSSTLRQAQGEDPELDLPLPSLDDVLPGGDLSAFLQSHVPATLKNAALRKMWEGDPTISGFIEMAENQWDFNAPDGIPGFASSIGDFDAKKLVDGLFNLTRRDDAEGEIPAADSVNPESEIASGARTDEPPELREATDLQAEIDHSVKDAETVATPHIALQKTQDESSVYDFGRRRHGGALPT
jgi:Protein of unknown function (DUF3306)